MWFSESNGKMSGSKDTCRFTGLPLITPAVSGGSASMVSLIRADLSLLSLAFALRVQQVPEYSLHFYWKQLFGYKLL